MGPIAGTITDPAVTRACDALPDVLVANEGTLFIVNAISRRAKAWLAEHVDLDEAQHWGASLVVEHRFIVELVDGMHDSGLVVR
jgi:hypothetical protein